MEVLDKNLYFCPTEKREYNSSAEDPDRGLNFRKAQEIGIKKSSDFMQIKFAESEKVFIFAVPIKGAQE